MINNNEVMETPFSLPLEDINFIKEQVDIWKKEKDRSQKIKISKAIAIKYGKDSKQYEYFDVLKSRKDCITKREKPKYKTQEGKEREIFNTTLVEYLDTYLMGRNDFSPEQQETLWNFGSKNSGGKLPNYFWIRMNKDVLPKIEKQGCQNRHAWLLAVGVIKQHEKEFISILQKVSFKDWNHISNTIIQFLNKYMIVAYMDLIKKARQEVIMKRKAEEESKKLESINALRDNPTEDFDPFEYKRKRAKDKVETTQSNPLWNVEDMI